MSNTHRTTLSHPTGKDHGVTTTTVTTTKETPDSKKDFAKPEVRKVEPEAKTLPAPSPTEQLIAALNAFQNAATGKISPGNAVWGQAAAAITSATRKA